MQEVVVYRPGEKAAWDFFGYLAELAFMYPFVSGSLLAAFVALLIWGPKFSQRRRRRR